MIARKPRIALIHALAESVLPAQAAFAEGWPECQAFDLLDTSLATDLADAGGVLDATMQQRFHTLADYALTTPGNGRETDAILFTCSAFGDALDAVKRATAKPVLRPNESAFRQALTSASRIGLLVTFAPSAQSLSAELNAMAAAMQREITVSTVIAEGALAALKAGDGALHDRLAAEAAIALADCEVVILGQFSLARAAPLVGACTGRPVITTPAAAVAELKAMLAGKAAAAQ